MKAEKFSSWVVMILHLEKIWKKWVGRWKILKKISKKFFRTISSVKYELQKNQKITLQMQCESSMLITFNF